MLRFAVFSILFAQLSRAEVCDTNPCRYGECNKDETKTEESYICTCERGWAGIHCDLPAPDVICGNRTISIYIDNRIVTEQELPSDAKFVHFLNYPNCFAEYRGGAYFLKVDAPFKDCGIEIKHDGDDYTFSQKIVWNESGESVERPLVLLDFKCTYQDKYAVSYGEIIPFETTVKFDTSYGVFQVDMELYEGPGFVEEEKYGVKPVIAVEDDVCVSTEFKNIVPQDLVLTNRECWASTQQDGSGESHTLVSGKCKDDPTTEILSNGVGNFSRFCFQMFKWRDSMKFVYVHCVVNVCNATAGEEYCQCEQERTKRFVRSVNPKLNEAKITFGPLYFKPDEWDEMQASDNNRVYVYPDRKTDILQRDDTKSTILIAVGIILVISVIILGVVVAVYINCRRKSRQSKSSMRSDGETVVIPNPTSVSSTIN